MADSFSSLFKALDTPYLCFVIGIKPNVPTKYGEKALITLVCNGVTYEWFASPATAAKQFAGINVNDWVEIKQTQNPTQKYKNYIVTKVAAPDGSLSPSVSSAGAPTVLDTSVVKTVKHVEDRDKKEIVKQNIITLSAYMKSLIERKEHTVEAAKELAKELVRWTFTEAEKMYTEQKNHEQLGTNLADL